MKSEMEKRIDKLNRQMKKHTSEKRTYTVEDIQSVLGISRPTAYKLIHTGQFPIVKVGTQIRIPIKAFDAWLEGGKNDGQ